MSDPDRNEPLSDDMEGHKRLLRASEPGSEEPTDEAEGHAVRRGINESDDEDTEGHRAQRDRI